MPRKKSEDSRKRVYNLWFESLLLSKNYKDYCEWKRKEIRNASELPGRFRKLDIITSFAVGYFNFGDIFNIGFDNWWAIKKNLFLARKPSRSVVNFADLFPIEIEKAIESFKLAEGREPSLDEFKWYLISLLDNSHKRIIISVTLKANDTIKDLSLQFDKLIKGLQPKFKSDHWPWKWKFPTTIKRIDEIQRYLEVYKLFLQGHSPPEIASRIKNYSDHKSAPRERHRMIQSDRRKAEGIIRNVEKGIFPGKY